MAKGKKQQGYTDALGSIFDFIFTSPKKKPVRIKPRKTTAKDANQALARGLAEIAGRPFNYLQNAGTAPMAEMGNSITLVNIESNKMDAFDGNFRRGKDNEAEQYRIRAGELAAFMKDPNKYIDSILDNAAAERKLGGYLNIGRGLDTALLAVWAKSQGLSVKDSAKVGFAASNFLGPDQLNEAKRSMIQNVVLEKIVSPTYGRQTAQEVFRALEEFNGTKIKSKTDLENLLKKSPNLVARSDFSSIVDDLYSKYESRNQKFTNNQSPYYTDGTINRYGYVSELSENYLIRAKLLDPKDPKQLIEQKRLLEAHQAMQTLLRMKGPGFSTRNFDKWADEFAGENGYLKYYKEKARELKTISGATSLDIKTAKDIEQLVKNIEDELKAGVSKLRGRKVSNWNILSTLEKTDNFSEFRPILEKDIDIEIAINRRMKALNPNDEDYYQNLIDSLIKRKRGLLTAPGLDWRLRIADTLSIYRSVSGSLLGPGLAASVASGVFFFKDDYIAPGKMGGHMVAGFDSKAVYGKMWAPGFVIEKGDISKSYASIANLFYLTPSSLVRSVFWNGELFAYGAFRNRQSLISSNITDDNIKLIRSVVGELVKTDKYLANIFKDPSLLSKKDLVKFLPVLHHYLEPKKGDLGDLWATFDAVFQRDQKSAWTRAMKIFGTPHRLFAKFADALGNNPLRKRFDTFLREKVYMKILPKAIGAKVASGLALRQAVSAVIAETLAAAGAAFGPLGVVATTLITFAAEAIADKLIKPFIKFFFAFLWAFILVLVAFLGFVSIILFNAVYPQPHQHLPPTDALECVEENPFLNVYKDDPIYAGGNYGNAPANSTCPILSSSMVCTQGDGPGSSSYHQQRHSLDIGTRSLDNPVWYAPTDGRVGNYSAVNYCSDGKDYGGALSFFDSEGNEYIILHVKALATGAVKKGQPVAIAQFDLQTSYCWTGPHFHLDVKHKGSFVDDTESWYRNELKCNIMSYDPTCHGK